MFGLQEETKPDGYANRAEVKAELHDSKEDIWFFLIKLY